MNMSTQSYEQLVAGANLIRQNELPESNTHTLVGEQMLQMVNKQQEADDSSRSEMYNVSRYHVNTDGTPVFTLDQAIALVPARLRVGGCVIKFQSDNGEVIAYFNGSNIASWSNVSEWRVFISDKDFQLAEKTANKNKANGYAGLDGTGKLLKAQLPDTYQTVSEKGRANGYPALDATGAIPDAQIPNTVERTSKKNQANGYPGLDGTGKLLKAQLPDTYQPISEKGRANGYPALDATGAIPDGQIPNTVERTSKKNQANGYAGLDADGMLDNRQVRKAFGYKFDGIDDGVVVNHNDLFKTGDNGFSFEILFKITPASRGILVSKINPGTGADSFVISIESGSRLQFRLMVDGVDYQLLTSSISSGKCYHAICTFYNNTQSIYINGELSAEAKYNLTPLIKNTANLNINLSGYRVNGDISLFRFFKRGFLQSDVDYYYNMGRPDLSRLTYSDKINKATDGCVVELLPENATASKWLDTQNNLDGITNGNPAINYGNCTPEPYIAPFKKYIGFRKNGDGSGYCTYSFQTNKSGYAVIRGGVFIDRTTLSEIGSSTFLPKDISTVVAFKLNVNKAEIEIDNLFKIQQEGAGHSVNSPLPVIEANEVVNNTGVSISEGNEVYGFVSSLPRDIIRFNMASVLNTSLSGQYRDLPKSLENLSLNRCPNISGDLSDLPKKLRILQLLNAPSTITGNLRDIPERTVRITISGSSSSISGDLASLKGIIESLSIYSINVTYSGGLKFSSMVDTVLLKPAVGVFTSAMTDKLLIDLAAQVQTATGSKMIDLTGNCGAPTALSSNARSYLSGLGFTVTTN